MRLEGKIKKVTIGLDKDGNKVGQLAVDFSPNGIDMGELLRNQGQLANMEIEPKQMSIEMGDSEV
jgi:hypothetical protein